MMDDTEDDVIYNSSSAGGDNQDQEGFDREKGAEREGSYTRLNNECDENQGEDEDDEEDEAPEELVEEEEEEEEEDDDDEDGDSVQRIRNNVVNDGDAEDVDEGLEEKRSEYKRRIEDINFERHPKKRRLNNLISKYEFAPRVAQAQPSSGAIVACPPPPPPAPKLSFGGRSALADWTEHETFVLLDAWGDRFLQHGRKSLRSEEWQEVALKVSQESKTDRTDTQCRNRLDTLKKKYKKEKAKFGGAGGNSSKWIYFKKMDVLMSPTPKQQPGLSCGVDSGEYVFSNPRVYLNRANGLDEMRDSPGHSDSTENDSDGLPPRRKKPAKISNLNTINKNDCTPMNLLADCLHNFSKIYEKVESSKRQQMVELEKMRMDFHRDLEQQKKLILERAQAEIAKIWQSDNADNGASAENISS